MALFVVKLLADGARRTTDSDVLCSYPFNVIWKIPANIEVFRNSVNISSVGGGIRCACREVHLAQVVHSFILQLPLTVSS